VRITLSPVLRPLIEKYAQIELPVVEKEVAGGGGVHVVA
jgi:hypothetical protein